MVRALVGDILCPGNRGVADEKTTDRRMNKHTSVHSRNYLILNKCLICYFQNISTFEALMKIYDHVVWYARTEFIEKYNKRVRPCVSS